MYKCKYIIYLLIYVNCGDKGHAFLKQVINAGKNNKNNQTTYMVQANSELIISA